MKYVPQLDSLRALAVFLVINTHWLGGFWSFGQHGVMIFFVLSGFLITYILLDVSENSHNKIKSIRQFVVRRALRIFPIYYLFILAFFIMGIPFMRQNFVWFFTYTSNIKYFLLGEFPEGLFSHLWSLAVEEQFYLFWPFLILFFRSKTLPYIISSLIIIGGLSRIFFYSFGAQLFDSTFSYTLTTSYSDTLGIGALLAYFYYFYSSKLKAINPNLIGVCSILLLGVYNGLSFFEFKLLTMFLMNTVFSFASSAVILFLISSPKTNYLNRLFSWSVFIFIGKISYGLYLYHKVIPWLIGYSCAKLGVEEPAPLPLYWMSLILLFTVAICSYYFIEAPINKHKSRFKYY